MTAKPDGQQPAPLEDRSPGELLRQARIRHELSQEQLAIRAGTTQSAIARIEHDRTSPSIKTLATLFQAMEEDFVFGTRPRDWGADLTLNHANLKFDATGRLERQLGFADFVREFGEEKLGDEAPWTVVSNSDKGPILQLPGLIEVLDRHAVDFVVIGGVAGIIHGSAYPTYDFDVLYARDEKNLERMARALQELDVTLRGAPADLPFQIAARTLAMGANFTFESDRGRLAILGEAAGMRSYEEVRADALVEKAYGFTVRVASIDDLIRMKRAAGRPKDVLMAEELTALTEDQRRAAKGEKGRPS